VADQGFHEKKGMSMMDEWSLGNAWILMSGFRVEPDKSMLPK
jgi:hypothetical protein